MSNQKLAGGLLIDEQFIQFSPTLACKLGISEAVMLQQIHWWVKFNEKKNKNFYEGFYWVYNSYPEWVEYMPFWTDNGIRKIIGRLRDLEVVVAKQLSPNKLDRSFYYRIDYEKLDLLLCTICPEVTDAPLTEVTDAPLTEVTDVYKEQIVQTDSTADSTLDETPQAAFSPRDRSENQNQIRETPSKAATPVLVENQTSPKAPSLNFSPGVRPKKQPKNPPQENEDFVDAVSQYNDSPVSDYSEEVESAAQRKEFLNLWREKTKELGGAIAAKPTLEERSIVKGIFTRFKEDQNILLEVAEWIFKNWSVIKEENKMFEKSSFPPLKTFSSNNVFPDYLTKFKQGYKFEKEITWTGEVKEWQKVRTKKGQLNQKFKEGKGE